MTRINAVSTEKLIEILKDYNITEISENRVVMCDDYHGILETDIEYIDESESIGELFLNNNQPIIRTGSTTMNSGEFLKELSKYSSNETYPRISLVPLEEGYTVCHAIDQVRMINDVIVLISKGDGNHFIRQ